MKLNTNNKFSLAYAYFFYTLTFQCGREQTGLILRRGSYSGQGRGGGKRVGVTYEL